MSFRRFYRLCKYVFVFETYVRYTTFVLFYRAS